MNLPELLAPAAPAIAASLLAGGATGLGAVVLLQRQRPGPKALARWLYASAGLMLAAALFSLLGPAIQQARAPLALDALLAAALGWGVMRFVDGRVAHTHAVPGAAGAAVGRPAMLLMVSGIAVHNLPEGFAVGAGFGGDASLGAGTAFAIGLQNVPEGLLVAMALWSAGVSRVRSALVALGTGLIEPVGATAGALLVGVAPVLLPLALAAAGGAMLYVVVDELLPEARRLAALHPPAQPLPASPRRSTTRFSAA